MDEVVEQVGGRLRRIRRARNMTLAELSGRVNLTSGYLANVEKGIAVPSLGALATLAAVLGTEMSAFFPTEERASVHVHRAADMDRLRVSSSSSEIYTVLSARSIDPAFTGLLDEVSPPDSDKPFSYSYFGERLAVILEGELEMRIGAQVHRLGPGDTLHYSSHPEHLIQVVSAEAAVILWVVTPAVL